MRAVDRAPRSELAERIETAIRELRSFRSDDPAAAPAVRSAALAEHTLRCHVLPHLGAAGGTDDQ